MNNTQSESVGALFTALCQFQGEVVHIYKDSQAFGFKYADLGSVLDVVKPLLLKNGLCVSQMTTSCERTGKPALRTVLGHSSGEWISGTMAFNEPEATKKNSSIQNLGSVITYMRRYAICAILGITQTDDEDVRSKEPVPEKPVVPVPEKIKPGTLVELEGYIASFGTSPDKIKLWLTHNKVSKLDDIPETFAQDRLKVYREVTEKMHQETQQQQGNCNEQRDG